MIISYSKISGTLLTCQQIMISPLGKTETESTTTVGNGGEPGTH